MANCADIKQRVRIEDVIGSVVPLKRHGHWYLGPCPFHDDRHPSLVVWPHTQTFKCKTCMTVRDDVVGFVARWRQCSTAEALHQLEAALPEQPVTPDVAKPNGEAAPVALRDSTYRALLSAWGLSTAHRAALTCISSRKNGSGALLVQAGFCRNMEKT